MAKDLKKRLKTIFAVSLITIIAVSFSSCGSEKTESENTTANNNSSNAKYSADNFKQTDVVEIDVKDYGKITVGLDANQAPKTVENFKKLVKDGFYDGLTFHRIIDGFMMQGGDPKGDGTGGSSENIKGEFVNNGVNNTLAHTRGAISMARAQDNDSASSQFFIVHKTSDNNSMSLDGQYACFGYVQSGMEVVDKIIADANPTDGNGTIAKDKQPVITSIVLK